METDSVSLQLYNLYDSHKDLKTSVEKINELVGVVSTLNISSVELSNASTLEGAKSVIDNMATNIETVRDNLQLTIDILKENIAGVKELFDYFEEQETELSSEVLETLNSIAQMQADAFAEVEYFDKYIEENSPELTELHKRISTIESLIGNIEYQKATVPWPDDQYAAFDRQIAEYNNELDSLTEEYATKLQDLMIIKQLRNFAFENAYNMYLGYDDFEENSVPQITSKQEGNIVYYGINVNNGLFFGDLSDYDNFGYYGDTGEDQYLYGRISEIALYQFYNNDPEIYSKIKGLTPYSENKINEYIENTLAYLTEDERKIITYLCSTGNQKRLNDYLAYMENKANQRHGEKMAQDVSKIIDGYYADVGKTVYDEVLGDYYTVTEANAFGNTMIELSFVGFGDGLNTFFAGLDNLANADGKLSAQDYKTQYLMQYLQDKFGEEWLKNTLLTGSYEISSSIGNMIPSVVVSAIPGGQWAGLALMGLSATGNARDEALKKGLSDGEAWLYGALSGLSEAGLEYALGGITKLASGKSAEALANGLGIPKLFAEMLSEGNEESLQAVLEPLFLTLATGGEIPYEVNWGEVLKSGIYGMITAGLMNTTGAGIEFVFNGTTYSITSEQAEALKEKFKNKDLTNSEIQELLETELERLKTQTIANMGENIDSSQIEELVESDLISEDIFLSDEELLTQKMTQEILEIIQSETIDQNRLAEIFKDSQSLEQYLTEQIFTEEQLTTILNNLSPETVATYVVDKAGDGQISEKFELLDDKHKTDVMEALNSDQNILQVIEKVADNTYAENIGKFYLKNSDNMSFSHYYRLLLNVPELVPYLAKDSNHFDYAFNAFVKKNYQLFSEKVLSNMDSTQLTECITTFNLGEMTEEQLALFEEQYPGVIDAIIERAEYVPAEKILNSNYLLNLFLNYEENKYIFAGKPREDYIKLLTEYITNNADSLANSTYLYTEMFKIDELKEQLLANDKICEKISQRGKEFIFLLEDDTFYQKIDKESLLMREYAKEILTGNLTCPKSRIADIMNTARNNYVLSNITTEQINAFIAANGILESDIVDRFINNHTNFTATDIQELVDYMSMLELLNEKNISTETISIDNINAIYNYINATLLENSKAIDRSHYQSHIYNFTMYYASINNIDISVRFYYADNREGGKHKSVNNKVKRSVNINTKFFDTKFKSDNLYLDTLETIFHECFHEMQYQEYGILSSETGTDVANKYVLFNVIDKLVWAETKRNNKTDAYYDSNYENIYFEIDARYNSFLALKNYVQEISPSTYAKIEEYLDETLEKNKAQYELNINIGEYNGQMLSRDMILDKIIKDNPKLLDENPILKNIYNEDGTRKTIIELQQAINNTTDPNIKEMLSYWIKNSKYSLDSFVRDLYEMGYGDTSLLLDNYDSILKDMTEHKLIEMMMLESNYFTDDSFAERVNNLLEEMKQKDPARSSDIDELGQLLLDEYNKYKTMDQSKINDSVLSTSDINIIIKWVEKNINNPEVLSDIIQKCDYQTYIALLNNTSTQSQLIPYLIQNKEYFSKMVDKNLNEKFDPFNSVVLSKIDVNHLHEYITLEQINSLSPENRVKFEELYPGVINKIRSGQNG